MTAQFDIFADAAVTAAVEALEDALKAASIVAGA